MNLFFLAIKILNWPRPAGPSDRITNDVKPQNSSSINNINSNSSIQVGNDTKGNNINLFFFIN